MNRIDFSQTGGFPFDEGTLDFLQSSTNLAAQTAALAGPFAILNGCIINSGNVSSGVVVINGEILPFATGAIDITVVIVETLTALQFEDGSMPQVEITRYATFGSGPTQYLWADFRRNTIEGVLHRLDRLEYLSQPFMIGGGMILWNKPFNQIPVGWQEVVDWRGRLPVGMDTTDPDFNQVGNTGGAKMHTNTIDELAPHTHGYSKPKGDGSATGNAISHPDGPMQPATSDISGLGQPYNIMNPYRVVVFIEPDPIYLAAV